jgi:hypothetical protein
MRVVSRWAATKIFKRSKVVELGEQPYSATGQSSSESSRTVASPVRESDQYEISIVRGPTVLFSWDIYISSLAGLCSLSWSFLLVIASFEPSKLSPSHFSCLNANS